MTKTYDATIIGGGHNGLVCAAYLAKKGFDVLVLEQRPVLGGACVTEEIDGCKVSRTSYVCSLFHPKIVRELDLHAHGLELLERDPPSFTPLKDGKYLFLYNDMKRTQQEIAKFSKADAKAYPEYEETLSRIARFVDERILLTTPPDPFEFWDKLRLAMLGKQTIDLGRHDISTLMKLFTSSAHDFVSEHFESEPLINTLCTDGIIGTFGGPFTPETAYVLLHHVMGEVNGHRGWWGYVRGGMGGLSEAIMKAGHAHGVEYRTDADVARILIEDGKAVGVALADGTKIRSKRVISNADMHVTFERLIDPGHLPDDFRIAVSQIDYANATSKINLILDGGLVFDCLKGTKHKVPGTFHICEDSEYIERSFDAAKYGKVADDLVLEGCIPSVVDKTLAPEGKHVLSLLVQYTPYDVEGGWTRQRKDDLLKKTIRKLAEYTNIEDVYSGTADVLTPVDLENEFRLTGGNLFHGAMSLRQLFFMRPVPGYAKYRTPIKNLWMCGSSTHQGGGVTGIPGHNCAREITSWF